MANVVYGNTLTDLGRARLADDALAAQKAADFRDFLLGLAENRTTAQDVRNRRDLGMQEDSTRRWLGNLQAGISNQQIAQRAAEAERQAENERIRAEAYRGSVTTPEERARTAGQEAKQNFWRNILAGGKILADYMVGMKPSYPSALLTQTARDKAEDMRLAQAAKADADQLNAELDRIQSAAIAGKQPRKWWFGESLTDLAKEAKKYQDAGAPNFESAAKLYARDKAVESYRRMFGNQIPQAYFNGERFVPAYQGNDLMLRPQGGDGATRNWLSTPAESAPAPQAQPSGRRFIWNPAVQTWITP